MEHGHEHARSRIPSLREQCQHVSANDFATTPTSELHGAEPGVVLMRDLVNARNLTPLTSGLPRSRIPRTSRTRMQTRTDARTNKEPNITHRPMNMESNRMPTDTATYRNINITVI